MGLWCRKSKIGCCWKRLEHHTRKGISRAELQKCFHVGRKAEQAQNSAHRQPVLLKIYSTKYRNMKEFGFIMKNKTINFTPVITLKRPQRHLVAVLYRYVSTRNGVLISLFFFVVHFTAHFKMHASLLICVFRCKNCVARQAGSQHSWSALNKAAAENPSLFKLLSGGRGTLLLSREGTWVK